MGHLRRVRSRAARSTVSVAGWWASLRSTAPYKELTGRASGRGHLLSIIARCRRLRLPEQEVANLSEEFLVLRQGREILLARPRHPAEELDDEQKEGEGNDQEIDEFAQEQAVGD